MGIITRKPEDMSVQQVADKGADAAVAGSAFLAGAAWVAEVEPIITAVAGLVAIIAGAIAAWYHFERAKMVHVERKIQEHAHDAAVLAAQQAAEAAAAKVIDALDKNGFR